MQTPYDITFQDRIIRSAKDPDTQINEDALCMMREIRISVQKDMALDPDFTAAIKRHASDIQHAGAKRINSELTEMLMSDHPDTAMRIMHDTGLMQEILPEIDAEWDVPQNNPYHIYNVGEHTMHVLANTPKNLEIRLAALLHDTGKVLTHFRKEDGIDHFYGHDKVSETLALDACIRLRYPKEITSTVCRLVGAHEYRPDPKKVTKFIETHQYMSDDEMMQLMDLQYADVMGQAPDQERIERRIKTKEAIANALQDPHRFEDLVLDENDIMQMQQTHKGETVPLTGQEINTAQKRLLHIVLNDQAKNTKDDLTYALKRELKSIRANTIDHLTDEERSVQKQAWSLRKQIDHGKGDPKDLAKYETPSIHWLSDTERQQLHITAIPTEDVKSSKNLLKDLDL